MQDTDRLQPTAGKNRITALDILRGISLLGILLMNIPGFGLYKAYDDITNSGGSTGWNLNVWWINSMFFEGTMRGIFSMLFGAGILIFMGRTQEGQSAVSISDLFFRRLLWLLVFGVLHCYVLLWDGEILYAYAIVGMFAYSFRMLPVRSLIAAATLVLLVATAFSVSEWYQLKNIQASSLTAHEKKERGEKLTSEDEKSIEAWDEKVKEMKATPEQLQEEIDARSKDYFSILVHKIPENQYMQTTFLYRINFWDILAMMLLWMALYKSGVIIAERSTRFYVYMILAGYSIGLTVNYLELQNIMENQFSLMSLHEGWISYNLGRVPLTIGHIGLIMLFIQSGFLPWLKRSLAAVGQMAFTNYLMQSVICNTIFLGFGFGLYGKLQRYELYYIVAGVWIFQLLISPVWMRHFHFGPMEWVWRSLTYWKKQPFKKIRT